MSPQERLYTVEAPQARREIDAHGNVRDVYDIFWTGPNNVRDKVTVDVNAYNAATVDRAIKLQLAAHLDVMKLGAE